MNEKNLLQERKELFHRAIRFEKTDRAPMFSNFYGWITLDQGYKLSEANSDYALMERIMRNFQERYQFDAYTSFGTRNLIRVANALGYAHNVIDDNSEAVTTLDRSLMEPEDYRLLIDNPTKFYWEKAFMRHCQNDLTISALKNAVQEFGKQNEYWSHMVEVFSGEYQCLRSAATFSHIPIDTLLNYVRGMKGVSMDLRRHKQDLKDACDAIFDTNVVPALKNGIHYNRDQFIASLLVGMISQSFLSAKQFEEFNWTYMKRIIDFCHENDMSLYIFCEASMKHVRDYFKDVPKGTVLMHLEMDDMFETRKELPNIALMGGMPIELLGRGTAQQCVDFARHLIDDMGEGYAFSTTKMVTYRSDCKRENLDAVTEFVRTYHA